MKINLFNKLKDVDGKDIIPIAGSHPMTLRDVIFNSILVPVQDEDEKKKYEKYEIYKKIQGIKKENVIDLTAEEIVTIKKSIGRVQPPLVMGQAFDMLEGKNEK